MELQDVTTALALKELELSAQGYPPHQVQGAIRYAWGRARGVALKAPEEYREPLFVATLTENLEAAARWLEGNAQVAADGSRAHGLDLAVRERRPQRGYRRMGLDGRHAAQRWKEGVPASKQGYDRFFGAGGPR